MADPTPTKKEIVNLVEAQANSIDSISERLVKLEKLIDKQDSRNQNIIIAVLVAFIFIIGTVAIEVILSDWNDTKSYFNLQNSMHEQMNKIDNVSMDIENIRKLNPYLK